MTCASTYNAGRGLWLHCTGDHLRGNVFRGEVHQQRYGGITWTWYSDEAVATRTATATVTAVRTVTATATQTVTVTTTAAPPALTAGSTP